MSKLEIQTFINPPFMECTYVVWDSESRDAMLIDPGGQETEIDSLIQNQQLHVRMMVATHGHVDHVAGAYYFQNKYGWPLLVHEKDVALAQNCGKFGRMLGIENITPPQTIELLTEGQSIAVGSFVFEVSHTPGHTSGHCVLYCAKAKVAIVGDVLFRKSIGRTDLPGGDFRALRDSILQKLYTLPDDTVVYPGHGETTTIGYEKAHNPFVRLEA